MHIHRSVLSIELLRVEVEAAATGTPVDITAYPVRMAVVEEGIHPGDDDYVTADWETIHGRTYATVLVGPGSDIVLALTDEVYIPWVKVNAGVEYPELKSKNTIEVY